MTLRFIRHRRFIAAAASAITLQAATAHADAAMVPPLRSLHEALTTGVAGRRYTKASPLGGSLWELSFATQDLRTKQTERQSQIIDLDKADAVAATLPIDPGTAVTRCPERGLELRRLLCEDGKKLACEVWTSGGVRLARRVIDGVGVRPLAPGVFGNPAFSADGGAVAFAAERLPDGAGASGYWPKDDVEKGAQRAGAVISESTEGVGAAGAAGTLVEGRFALRDGRTTGEMLGVHNAQLVVWNWRTDALDLIRAEEVLPEGSLPHEGVAVPSQVCFDGSSGGLIFACHLLPPHRPGVSACLNRPTRLFHLQHLWYAEPPKPTPTEKVEGASAPSGEGAPTPPSRPRARCLTPSLYLAHMPRLSPDGTTLAYVARRAAFQPHSTVFELRTIRWPPTLDDDASDAASAAGAATLAEGEGEGEGCVLVPIVREVPPAASGADSAAPFAGVTGFHDELASLAFLDAHTLVFHTVCAASKATFTVTVPPPATPMGEPASRRMAEVVPLRPPAVEGGSVELLGTSDGVALLQCSSLRSPPSVWAYNRGRWSCVVDLADLAESLPSAHRPNGDSAHGHASLARDALRRLRHARLERVTLPPASGGAEALVLLPPPLEGGTPDDEGVPWVLKLHGGPHAASLDAFNVEAALFVASGVAVLYPNYRGSLGYGSRFVDALPGHIGDIDVADCVALTRAALQQYPHELDPAAGACYGGSHGGFLTAWLLGCDESSLFACGALWNPVVDLPAMVGTTDIPEWVVAEALPTDHAGEMVWPLRADDLLELHRRSPLSVVDRVHAPALMLLGAADQRVPHSQGRSWVAALQHVRRHQPDAAEVVALEFPGEGHAIGSVEGNAHAVQSAVAWLVEKLRTRQANERGRSGP